MTHRRDFLYRAGTIVLSALGAAVLAVPGAAYLLSPILRRASASAEGAETEGFAPLARLGELEEGVPKGFPIVAERTDAWVKYPKEPIGSVWLVRRPEGAGPRVVAFSAECPHLGCGVNLSADRRSFACPCHNSAFRLDGTPINEIPPRPLDSLEVALGDGDDPMVSVRFRRFRSQTEEKIPLA